MMTVFTPREYQRTAIGELTDALDTCLDQNGTAQRVLVFKAPTGSGKTIMLALALESAHRRNIERPFITLWLTPGKGNLEEQSAVRLGEVLAHSPTEVALLTPAYLSSHETIHPGTVLVSNWESLVQWDTKRKDWKNHLTRDGEQRNLFQLLTTCATQGTDLVLVFDESHTHVSGDRSRKLLAAIAAITPFVELHASATPRDVVTQEDERKLTRTKRFHYIEVDFYDVVEAGMVKRTAELNVDFDDVKTAHPEMNGEQLAVQAAWMKLNELRDCFAVLNSPVRPLLLVQVPDSDAGDQRLQAAIDFFTDVGLTMDEELAIWTSDWKSANLDGITTYASPARVLLFKQAVATGWDCPRAHVLVQFRETNSTSFAIQTLGRILRMPEQRHYDDERLNKAYVYSDLPDEHVTVSCDDEPDRTVIDTTLVRRADLYGEGLALRSIWAPRQRDFDYVSHSIASHLMPRLDGALGGLPVNPVGRPAAEVLLDVSIATADLASLAKELDITGDTLAVDLSQERVRVLFDALLVSDIRPYPQSARRDSRPRIKTTMLEWFRKNRPSYDASDIAAACLGSREMVTAAIHEACEALGEIEATNAVTRAREGRQVIEPWELPTSPDTRVASITCEQAPGPFVYEPALARKAGSGEEHEFEDWLVAQKTAVKWWWRNGSRDAVSLAVTYPDKLGEGAIADANITYPDYVFLTRDSVLWVVEVKPLDDREGGIGGSTHLKALGLVAWAEEMNQRPRCPGVLPVVRTAVVVPHKSGSNTVMKAADQSNWQPPTRESLAGNRGWTLFSLG